MFHFYLSACSIQFPFILGLILFIFRPLSSNYSQQFELSSNYILHDFSIILKRFVGAFDPSEQSLYDQKRGGAKRNCSEAECVGADLSFCSFP